MNGATSDFTAVAGGDRIAAQFGGRSEVRVLGTVVRSTAGRFVVLFPATQGALPSPITMTFRRSDGRSVGGRYYKFASKAGDQPGDDGSRP